MLAKSTLTSNSATTEPLLKGKERISTVDLHVLTSLGQLLLISQELLTFLQNKLPLLGGQMYKAFPFG
jgi:hypothetical protein